MCACWPTPVEWAGERRLGSWQPRCLTSGRTRSFIYPDPRNAGPAPSDPTAKAHRGPRHAKRSLSRRACFPVRGGDPTRPRCGSLPFTLIVGVFNRGGLGPPSLPQGCCWPRNRPNLATLPLWGPECRDRPNLAFSGYSGYLAISRALAVRLLATLTDLEFAIFMGK